MYTDIAKAMSLINWDTFIIFVLFNNLSLIIVIYKYLIILEIYIFGFDDKFK